MDRAGYEAVLADPEGDRLKRLWAERQIALLDRHGALPGSVPVTTHGIRIGKDVRMVGLEGEPVAELGNHIIRFYGGGVTFPLGYTDGAQLYLPTDAMLDEGGYEVESYYEYGFPAPLAKGIEQVLDGSLAALRESGVC